MPKLKSPKAKGDRVERELAKYFTDHLGIDIYRTPLSGGGRTSPITASGYGNAMADLTGTPRLHVEVKATETFRPREAMRQAEVASKDADEVPVVINKQNRQSLDDCLCVLRLSDFIELYKIFLQTEGYIDVRQQRSAI